jgi:hypothetical protein
MRFRQQAQQAAHAREKEAKFFLGTHCISPVISIFGRATLQPAAARYLTILCRWFLRPVGEKTSDN